MQAERLLERLRYTRLGVPPSGSEVARFIASVARYLSLLLNTQQGNAVIAADFGMPDLNQVRFAQGAADLPILEKTITDTILKYEPRVKQVQVNFTPQEADPLSLVFRITLDLIHQQTVVPVVFETIMDADGRISVKRS